MIDRRNCTGCGSCAAKCPNNCIKMEADAEGFLYPVVDKTYCVHCGLCKQACPALTAPPRQEMSAAFAAQNQDDYLRQRSSSGGVFSALAEDVLHRGGIVCAAVFDMDHSVRHIIVKNEDQLHDMRGAKYAQSRVELCFPGIRDALEQNIPVLFVGTPCQCAGLLSYLGHKDSNLLLVDMICHGAPSPKVWKDYLAERLRLDAPESVIKSINLRSKATGWSRYSYCVEIQYQDGTTYRSPQREDPFMQGFVQNLFLRPSCADCPFKGLSRCSDLTLGDYWGIWEQHPDFDDNKGTSLLLVHSRAGKDAWARISAGFRVIEVAPEAAVAMNPSAVQSSAPHPSRQLFFHKYEDSRSLIRWMTQCLTAKHNLFQKLLQAIRK